MSRLLALLLSALFTLSAATAQTPQPKGERLLGLGLTEGTLGFDATFAVAKQVGVQVVELPQQWDDLEPRPGTYKSVYLEAANRFFPANDVKLVVSLNPIDTTRLRLPKDLVGKAFNDPLVIERYKSLADYVIDGLANADIAAFVVGNEVDAYLGDEAAWLQYAQFFSAVRSHIKARLPDSAVGVKVTLEGALTDNQGLSQVLAQSDAVMVSYYPLAPTYRVKAITEVDADLSRLVERYTPKPIYLLEAGYPSGSDLGSSEEQQAAFVTALFNAWDKFATEIRLINIVWLHDLPPSELEGLSAYYGLSSDGFVSFLASLGLKHYDGVAKPAFLRLQEETERRGW